MTFSLPTIGEASSHIFCRALRFYWPRDGGFPKAEVITDVDPFEFMDRAKGLTGTSISTFHADVRILSARGYKKLSNGDTAGALADADRAIPESRSREGWSLRGRTKSSLGDEIGALSDFEEAVRATPLSPECWNKLGLSLSRLMIRMERLRHSAKQSKLNQLLSYVGFASQNRELLPLLHNDA